MPAAPSSPNEQKRLAAVQQLGLLGTPAEERFDRITRLARQLFDVPMAVIDIVGEKLAWLKSIQGFDGVEGLKKDSYCHYTVKSDEIYIVPDARLDPQVCDSAFADTWVFYAGVSLHFKGERVGVLCIGDSKPREFSAEALAPLFDLARLAERELQIAALSESQLALALSNEELRKKANIDFLTRVWNREAILNITTHELTVAQAALADPANRLVMALLMIDLDNFKAVNDTYGHSTGDQVLREAAERLRRAIRPKDAIGRYGGDEFLVVMTQISSVDVMKVATKIRQEIVGQPIQYEGHTIEMTCSIGWTVVTAADDVKTLLHRADQALYHAKAMGGNYIESKK